jgi:hypothetical protein
MLFLFVVNTIKNINLDFQYTEYYIFISFGYRIFWWDLFYLEN